MADRCRSGPWPTRRVTDVACPGITWYSPGCTQKSCAAPRRVPTTPIDSTASAMSKNLEHFIWFSVHVIRAIARGRRQKLKCRGEHGHTDQPARDDLETDRLASPARPGARPCAKREGKRL